MNTKQLLLLTAKEILAKKTLKPEDLFVGVNSEKDLKRVYIKLSFKWHPDHNKEDTNDVFSHINVLYQNAKNKFSSNTWNKGLFQNFIRKDGNLYQYSFIQEFSFELGKYYLAKESIAWVFEKDFLDLAENALKKINNLKYADENMRNEMKKFIPEITQSFITKEDKAVIIFKRDCDSIMLCDVLNKLDKVGPKHVAWILSNCYNLACFMQYNKIMHGGFSLDNISINPQNHSCQLLGGWWFTHIQKEPLKALSSKTLSVAPFEMINSKKATFSFDLECIRFIGRSLLGDKNGLHLTKDKDIPVALVQWLRNASKNDAFNEYALWQKVLTDSFGVRRFTKMELNSNDVYN